MLDAFNARLEACDPTKGHFRSYRIAAGTDLFGEWLVEIQFGRIGVTGRRMLYSTPTEADSARLIAKLLKSRATAERRIGTGYQLKELYDPRQWYPAFAA